MTAKINHYQSTAKKRALRVRSKMHGTAYKPRLSVIRSNKHLSVQAIDDDAMKTIAMVSDMGKAKMAGTKTERATAIGTALAKLLKKHTIVSAIFDRGSRRYHGRVQAVAESLRAEGIKV